MTQVLGIAVGLLFISGAIGVSSAQAFSDSITIENVSQRTVIAVFRMDGDVEQHIVDIPASTPQSDTSNVRSVHVVAGETLRIKDLSRGGSPILRLIEIHPTAFHGTSGDGPFSITKINRTQWVRMSPDGGEQPYVQIATTPTTMTLWSPDDQGFLYLPTSNGPCFERGRLDAPEQRSACGELVVSGLSHHFTIFDSSIPFNDLSGLDKPDDTALLAGYDIDKVDPMKITDGMKRQIFQGIDNTGINYEVSSGAAHLRGLHYTRLNEGQGSTHSQLTYNQRSLLESWNVGIEVGVGDTGKGTPVAGKASASYSEMSGRMSENRSYFAIGREKHSLYSMSPLLGQIELHRDFIDAVGELPLPPSNAGTQQAMPASILGAYQAFIKEWGGFYPTSVIYGSASFLTEEITSAKIEEISEKGWNAKLELEGAIKGVPVSGSVSGGQTTQEKVMFGNEDVTSNFKYVGGAGSGAPDFGTAQPVDIAFAPISELLTPVNFGERFPFEELEQRRQFLETVVQTMYPAGPEAAGSPLEFFDVEITSMSVTAERSPNGGVYGKVFSDTVYPDGVSSFGGGRLMAFSRSSDSGERITLEKHGTFSFDGGKRQRVAIARTATSSQEPVSFAVSAPLSMFYLLEKPTLYGGTTCTPAVTSDNDPKYGSWTDFTFTSTHDRTSDYQIEVTGRCRAVPRWMVKPREWDLANAFYVCFSKPVTIGSTFEEFDAAEKLLLEYYSGNALGQQTATFSCSERKKTLQAILTILSAAR